MPHCVIKMCKNYSSKVSKQDGVSYFHFPRDYTRGLLWRDIIAESRREEDFNPKKTTLICSDHFAESDMYETNKGLRRLKNTAVPTLGLNEDEFNTSENKKSVKTTPTTAITTGKTNANERLHVALPSNMYSIYDSPQNEIQEIKNKKNEHDKTKPHMKNSNSTRKNERFAKTCGSLTDIVQQLRKRKFVTEDQYHELKQKAEVVELPNRIFYKSNLKSDRKKYPLSLRKFAVTLHYYSPAAYKYVRTVFETKLPHPRVLGQWCENDFADPGFSRRALDILKAKHKATGKRLICTLITNEMALRHQTIWTGKNNAGIVDFGVGSTKSSEIATRAYVFLLVSLNENWKIPVAYFLVNELPAETRVSLLTTCLRECYRVGVDIVAVTLEGSVSNINMANLLGCDLNNPECLKSTFKHPECDLEVAIMLDPCHVIKLVRNTLEAKRLLFDENGKTISWQLLKNLVMLQKNTGLNFANKTTPRHIQFRNEVMKMKLATQIMSSSAAKALNLCKELITSSLFIEPQGTIDFVTIFNNIFEVFNSVSTTLNGLAKPICLHNAEEVFKYLEKARKYILGLHIFIKYRITLKKRIIMKSIKRRLVESENKTGFLGFLICIASLKHLFSTLIEREQRLSYIATYRLSQDHIETLFGTIKKCGRYNHIPNAVQFKEIFTRILQHLELSFSNTRNCMPLENISILTCFSAVQNINSTTDRRANDEESIILVEDDITMDSDIEVEENVEIFSSLLDRESLIATTNQIVGYISGWISTKLVKLLKCETCIDCLFTKHKMWFHRLITLSDMGGTCYPSKDLFRICLRSEKIIKNHIKEKEHVLSDVREVENIKTRILKTFINSPDLLQSLDVHSWEKPVSFNHRLQLIRAIIEKYVDVRFHHAHKHNAKRTRNKLKLF